MKAGTPPVKTGPAWEALEASRLRGEMSGIVPFSKAMRMGYEAGLKDAAAIVRAKDGPNPEGPDPLFLERLAQDIEP